MRERQRIVSRSYIPQTEVSLIAMSPPPPTRCLVLQCMRIVMGLCGDTSAQQHGVGRMDKLRSSTFLPPVHNRSLVVYQPPIHEGPWASALGFRRECSTEPVGPGEHIRKTACCFSRFSCLIDRKAGKAPHQKAAIKIAKQIATRNA